MRTRVHIPWTVRLCFPLGVLGAVTARLAYSLPGWYREFLDGFPAFRAPCHQAGVGATIDFLATVAGVAAGWWLVLSLLGFVRRRRVLAVLRQTFWSIYAVLFLYGGVVLQLTGLILPANLAVNGQAPTAAAVFDWRWQFVWPALAVALGTAVLQVLAWRRSVTLTYVGQVREDPDPGDRVLENLRTGGADPAYRAGVVYSSGAHLLILIVIPWLLAVPACVSPSRLPAGDGAQGTAAASAPSRAVNVQVRRLRRQPPRVVVNPRNTDIVLRLPELDNSPTLAEVATATEKVYVVDPLRVLAGPGMYPGSGTNTRPGFHGADRGGAIRFIRLRYGGEGWDDGMDDINCADLNFLREFGKRTQLRVATRMESHPVASLRQYPKGQAPPFVFMCGRGGIAIGSADQKILRDYLYGGSLLFADCGSAEWDRSFRDFVRALLPGEPLITISDDDPLFQAPYSFPRGAPALWHHGGTRAMGVRHHGRWIVFYHPGDLHDAWKTGNSGLETAKAEAAVQVGVNVVGYACSRYLEATRRYRK